MASYFVWALAVIAAISCPAINADNLGEQVSLSEVPSIAQIEFRVMSMWVQQCVASVLTSVHVLAPASCFSGDFYSRENRRVRAGAETRGEDGVIVEVGIAYNHPDFGTLGLDSDISVIRLASALPLDDNIQQVSILGQGIELPVGLSVQLYGWGSTAQGGTTSDADLYQLDLYTKNNERCLIDYYLLEDPKIVTENMICLGLLSGGRDFDARDLGAPLFYQNVLVAKLSFGESTDNNDLPVVATAIGAFTEWIIETAI